MASRFHHPSKPLPIETYALPLPAVPQAAQGLRIAHISDLHVRAARCPKPVRQLLETAPTLDADLVCLTGDYMDDPGDEDRALGVLSELADAIPARAQFFGVFGNHDSPALVKRARSIDRIRWLDAEAQPLDTLGITIAGAGFPDDMPRTALALRALEQTSKPSFTILLAHYPTEIVPAAALGIPLVLSGHTHGGQVRISPKLAPHTSSDLPSHLASGVLKLGATRCCVSRGVGDGFAPIRINCPPQLPIYTLERMAPDTPDTPDQPAPELCAERRW